MEIYSAISDFTSPDKEGSQNILSFKKGDTFEIFDCNKTNGEWWGAKDVAAGAVGYVPSKYMKFEERKIGKLIPDDLQSQKEESIPKFTEMENQSPDDQYDIPEPEPDYNDVDEVDSAGLVQENGEPVIIRPRGPSESEKRLSDPNIENCELSKPRKISNPCMESKERMALHKELKSNYKIGKNVLEKPELAKVLDQRKEKQRVQEWEEKKKAAQKRSSFEYKLEQQASKLKEQDDMKPIKEESQSELSKIQAKILSKSMNGKISS